MHKSALTLWPLVNDQLFRSQFKNCISVFLNCVSQLWISTVCSELCFSTMYLNYVYVQQSGCWWASAPSPLTGFAIVCPCSHYDTATIAYKCSQFNSRYNCVQMFAIRDEMTDTGGDCACQAINGSPEKEKCHWCLKQYHAVYVLHSIETDCRKKLQSIQWTLFMQLQTKKYNPKFKI